MTLTVPTYPDLAGKVAVVTGGSRGIGAQTCRYFAANGMTVVVSGRDKEAIDAVVADLRAESATAVGVAADVTDADDVAELLAATEREVGPPDVLAAFAGFDHGPAPLADVTEERWHEVLDGNLTSVYLTVRAFLPGMVARGGGSIITMASSAGRQVGQSSIPYAAAKAGLLMFTKRVATDVAKDRVRINTISPAGILTERQEQRIPEQKRAEIARTKFPIPRWGTPADCANAALFLASSASAWITGQTIDVTGGKVMV
ncbi:MAG: SDR family oxidoreductase [Pseudonocardiaceae bacterium]|nr:SDR family oxidoreductase [Pseudonocardiaceae bacterium]